MLIYLLGVILGSFGEFRLQNSLIRHIYPVTPVSPSEEGKPESAEEARKFLLRTVAERDRYWYNYHEFLFA